MDTLIGLAALLAIVLMAYAALHGAKLYEKGRRRRELYRPRRFADE